MARTVACLAEYAELARSHGVSEVAAVCTSAARDADNGAEFIDMAAGALGVTPRIIAGEEEARLTFEGAIQGLRIRGRVTVFDIGGGSTEIILGTVSGSDAQIHEATSLNIGSVRLTERHVRHDPPTSAELEALRTTAREALDRVPRQPTTELVGVAGTITTLASIRVGLASYDPNKIHGVILHRAEIEEMTARLALLPLSARKATPGLDPARADVIVAGACLALQVLDWARADALRVSDRGVRFGLAKALLRS